MPPGTELVASAVALWLALVLLLPKRDWRSIPRRLRSTVAGERRHLFGPPSASATGDSLGVATFLAAEAPRCLELGVPLWLAGLLAGRLGAGRRREAEAAWATSAAGLVHDHLLGRLSQEELEHRLSEDGHPLPATKAWLRLRLGYTMPPMAWLRERAASDGPAETAAMVAGADGLDRDRRLTIQTLGRLRIAEDGEDLSGELLARPTLSYLWQQLLVRAIAEPGRAIPRSAVADELYPGLDRGEQLKRLRHLLYDLQQKLPAAFSRPITITKGELRFDPTRCGVDAVDLLQLAERCSARSSGLLPESLAAQVEDAVAVLANEFLPDWDDLEERIAAGRGTTDGQVRSIRPRLQRARVTLLARLGAHHLSRRDAGRAAAALDEALALDPGRAELAAELVTALEAAGQTARAAEVRRRFLQPDE